MECHHINFEARVDVQRVTKEEHMSMGDDAPVEVFVCEIALWCKDCRVPFHFQWHDIADPNVIPLGTAIMKRRPWVSFMGGQLMCSVEPQPLGHYKGQVEGYGNA